MALTYTPPGELGSPCPDFSLPGVDGRSYKRDDFNDKTVLVVGFICNHCPYVQAIEDRLIALAKHWAQGGRAQLVGICANDWSEHPEDRPEELRRRWHEKGYGFPYLIDEAQALARGLGAVCTPDFFVFGQDRRLVYRGRLDDSWRNPQAVRRQELKEAVAQLLSEGRLSPAVQNPSMGCSIKWKSAST